MKEFKRVKYQKSPLVEVIFQLRFPTILSINAKQPIEFQEKIREKYPFYQEDDEQQNEMIIDPNGNPVQFKASSLKNYAFISPDESYKINLTSSFISISTLKYTYWDEFKKHIEFVIPIFEEIYKPAFYTRVGLRYIDVIIREDLGLQNVSWNELIEPHVLGIITPEIESGVKYYSSDAEYQNPTDNTATKVHFELVHANNQKELSLLIDCDYYLQSVVENDKVNIMADKLHKNSSDFINNAITEKLSSAMEPVEI